MVPPLVWNREVSISCPPIMMVASVATEMDFAPIPRLENSVPTPIESVMLAVELVFAHRINKVEASMVLCAVEGEIVIVCELATPVFAVTVVPARAGVSIVKVVEAMIYLPYPAASAR